TEYKTFSDFLQSSKIESLSDFPASLAHIAAELSECKILTKDFDTDDKVITYFRSMHPEPAISGCYFILSEQCNLACKYCFLGNNNPEKRKHFSLQNMSMETAEKALNFFIRQLEKNENVGKPFIVFYGGEPLINFEVLDFIADRINKLRLTKSYFKDAVVSVVTNGLLLDEKKLKRLKELNVNIGISIDGCTEESNALRVDRAGKPVFSNILKILDMAKDIDIGVGLSVTLNEEAIKNKSEMLGLISKYNIKGFGFNILMPEETFKVSEDYNEKASQFIIDMFVELRKIGIYEDRIMRKVKTFQDSYSEPKHYYSDCGATAGGQLVFVPDGSIGICQGCLWNKKYF
ncbi:FibroRumin system radical SAM peptide maturase, partial [Treponema sp. R8-4-B8]